MKTPAALEAMTARFDRMSLRERLLVFAALLAGVLVLWQSLFMEQLGRREQGLSLELNDLQDSVSRLSLATEAVASTDPTTAAMKRLRERETALDAINAKLAAESAGVIPPAQMAQVIHEVLKHQQGLMLVSLRNLPVRSLVPETKATGASDGEVLSKPAGNDQSSATPDPAQPVSSNAGPYLHPVELIIEGRYLDIVAYLHALESLQWHFYWRVLELETKQYPLNRVRIELSTVSLDKEWIGV
jgi:MSHA biogenesis protein MshJ